MAVIPGLRPSWGSGVQRAVVIGYSATADAISHLKLPTDSNLTLRLLLQIERMPSAHGGRPRATLWADGGGQETSKNSFPWAASELGHSTSDNQPKEVEAMEDFFLKSGGPHGEGSSLWRFPCGLQNG